MRARLHTFSRCRRALVTATTTILLSGGMTAAAQAHGTHSARAAGSRTACRKGCVMHSDERPSHATRHSARRQPTTSSVSVPLTPVPVKHAPPVPSGSSVVMPSAAAGTAPCANGNLTPGATNLPQVEAATICLVNQVRAQHSLPPLTLDHRLQTSAQQHNTDMVTQDYFAHVGPDGDTPMSRIQAAGYGTNPSIGYILGENIAWGTLTLSTPAAIVQAWVNSPDHLANILEKDYTVTGLAIAPQVPNSFAQGQSGAIYTQDFGGVDPTA